MVKQQKSPERKKTPPDSPIESVQFNLFGQFITNNKREVSNALEVWETIPKYFFTAKQMENLRTADGLASFYKYEYEHNHVPCAVKIQPALIEQENGKAKAFFPSVTEELVEEAIKKIFTDQQYGIHDPDKTESWVKFSLSMVYKELKSKGRTRSYTEIKKAIEVMSSCVITFYSDHQEVWKGTILQDLVTVNRDEYRAKPESLHAARLPFFISQSINRLDYRQFNYQRLMSCNEQLSRWLYKQLINRFRQASMINHYHFMYSSIARSSGLLQQGKAGNNRRKMKAALDELVKQDVLLDYQAEARYEGRKVVDVKYTLKPSMSFVREQKAANKRASDAQAAVKQARFVLN